MDSDLIDISKQRRNIIIVSFVLIFIKYSGAKITIIKSSGVEISSINHNAVEHLLWVVFIYFLIRYYQVFCEVGSGIYTKKITDEMKRYFKNKILTLLGEGPYFHDDKKGEFEGNFDIKYYKKFIYSKKYDSEYIDIVGYLKKDISYVLNLRNIRYAMLDIFHYFRKILIAIIEVKKHNLYCDIIKLYRVIRK